jgi:hypothetical protein
MVATAEIEVISPIATWKVLCHGDHIWPLGQSGVLDLLKEP